PGRHQDRAAPDAHLLIEREDVCALAFPGRLCSIGKRHARTVTDIHADAREIALHDRILDPNTPHFAELSALHARANREVQQRASMLEADAREPAGSDLGFAG